MKNSEFKTALDQKPVDSILRNQSYTLNIPSENYKEVYDLIGLHKVIENKQKKWEQISNTNEFYDSRSFFNKVLQSIEDTVSNTRNNDSISNNNIVSSLKPSKNVLLPDSAKSLFLQNLSANYPKYLSGAFSMLTNSINNGQFSNIDYFKGAFLAARFEIQGIDTLSEQETETMSLNGLRSEFEIENARMSRDFENVIEESRIRSDSEIKKLEELFETWNSDYKKQLDELKAIVEIQINKSNIAGGKLLKRSLDKKIQLEQTYREQMRFKAPAEYWRERAILLNAEGRKFMGWLIFLVIIGVLVLYSLLWLTPEDILESIFSGSPAKAIRWSIIFITLVSLLFVGIQAIKKAMFSSYHLARDAEEREKLTVFYLSLTKDSTITQEDRSLVLQALFSRADTGMLKDEGNPTMPGILDKIKN